MLELRFPSALAMDQPGLLADGLHQALQVPVGKRVTLDLTDLQRVSAFGLAALGARLVWLIRTRRMPSGSTIRRPESNRVGNDLLRMGLYRLIQEGSDQVYRASDPTVRPQELWLVDRLEDLPAATRRLCGLLRLVVPASEENFAKVDVMMQALGGNVFGHSGASPVGVLCAQAFPKSGTVEFAMADAGEGLMAGLRRGGARAEAFKDDTQALQAALSGTCDGGKPGGLATLAATAKLNRGEMTVLSGGAWWMFRAGQVQTGVCKPFPGTVVGMKLPILFEKNEDEAGKDAAGAKAAQGPAGGARK